MKDTGQQGKSVRFGYHLRLLLRPDYEIERNLRIKREAQYRNQLLKQIEESKLRRQKEMERIEKEELRFMSQAAQLKQRQIQSKLRLNRKDKTATKSKRTKVPKLQAQIESALELRQEPRSRPEIDKSQQGRPQLLGRILNKLQDLQFKTIEKSEFRRELDNVKSQLRGGLSWSKSAVFASDNAKGPYLLPRVESVRSLRPPKNSESMSQMLISLEQVLLSK